MKGRFIKMTFKSHVGVVFTTVQSRLLQPALRKEKPEFSKPNEAMIDQVICIVEGSTTEELKKLMAHITSEHIAQLVLDLTHSF